MKYPVFIYFLLVASAAFGIDLNSITLGYQNFVESTNHDPILERVGSKDREAVNLGINFDLFKGAHWDNWILARTDTGGYRSVAWDFRAYLTPFPALDIGYHHRSQHLLDREEGTAHFPVEDSFEIIWRVYTKDPGFRSSIF